MKGPEAVTDFFGVFFAKNIRSPHSIFVPRPAEGDVSSPGIIPPEEVEAGTPSASPHLHPPGLDGDRGGSSPVSRARGEFLLEVCIQMVGPIRPPNVEGREWEDILEVKEEGGQWVLSKGDSVLSCPHPGLGIERPDGLLREERNQCMGLAAPVRPISGLQFRIL
jgi:hypothetical protein